MPTCSPPPGSPRRRNAHVTTRTRPRTIAKHLEHVYRKLGVTSRAAAVYRTATATATAAAPAEATLSP